MGFFPLFVFFYFAFIVDKVDGPWDALRIGQQPIVALASNLGTIAALIWAVALLVAILLLVWRGFRKSATSRERWLGLLPTSGALIAGGALALFLLFRSYQWAGLDNVAFALFWFGALSIPVSIALAIAKSSVEKWTLRIFLLLSMLMSVGMALYQMQLMIDQGVTSFLWPGGNWSLRLIVGLLLMLLPTLAAFWLLIRNWIALPPSSPLAEEQPLQARQQGY